VRATVTSSDTADRARLLAGIAAACVVLLGILYVFAVRTSWGQRLGDAALGGRVVERPRVQHAMRELLDTISISSIALLGLGIVAIALFRGRFHLAVAAGAVIVGSNVTTQLLKKAVLTRPALIASSALPDGNSFPSGHATVAMSLALAFVLVVPTRLRGVAALFGVAYSTLVGMAVLGAGWHRPSDAVGAYLVVTAWAAAATGVLVLRHGDREVGRARRPGPIVMPMLAIVGVLALAAAFVLLAGLLLALHRGRLEAVDVDLAYLTGSAAIAGAGLLLVAVLLGAIRGIDLDEPRGHATAVSA